MRVLFLFLDGVGLGGDDPLINPLAGAAMPNMRELLGNKPLTRSSLPVGGRLDTSRATLLALDTRLGVEGMPQSATGQSVLLTGINIPASIGEHYGPKPNPEIALYLQNGNLFSRLTASGFRAGLLNAYPPTYFAAIQSGKRIYSAIPLTVTHAGLPLLTKEDLAAGNALAVDFTAEGWHTHLALTDTPVLTPLQAGRRLGMLAKSYDLAFFEYWLSDYAGHRQDMPGALALLEIFDVMLGGLLESWVDSEGLILITSDHGNMEDLTTRRHTLNPVPGLIIGDRVLRDNFAQGLFDLTGITPAIWRLITQE